VRAPGRARQVIDHQARIAASHIQDARIFVQPRRLEQVQRRLWKRLKLAHILLSLRLEDVVPVLLAIHQSPSEGNSGVCTTRRLSPSHYEAPPKHSRRAMPFKDGSICMIALLEWTLTIAAVTSRLRSEPVVD